MPFPHRTTLLYALKNNLYVHHVLNNSRCKLCQKGWFSRADAVETLSFDVAGNDRRSGEEAFAPLSLRVVGVGEKRLRRGYLTDMYYVPWRLFHNILRVHTHALILCGRFARILNTCTNARHS